MTAMTPARQPAPRKQASPRLQFEPPAGLDAALPPFTETHRSQDVLLGVVGVFVLLAVFGLVAPAARPTIDGTIENRAIGEFILLILHYCWFLVALLLTATVALLTCKRS